MPRSVAFRLLQTRLRVLWWYRDRVTSYKTVICKFKGHRPFYDCDMVYCTRCHRWQMKSGEWKF